MEMLGKFEIVSGKVRVSDPCYDLKTWCAATIENVKNGTWLALAEMEHGRISILEARHESCGTEDFMELVGNEAGVDSGQAGIFDLQHFKDDSVVPKDLELEPYGNNDEAGDRWYDLCCSKTVGEDTPYHYEGDKVVFDKVERTAKDKAGVIPFGCVSSSGYGDGGYPISVAHEKGEVVGIRITYIGEEEDEMEDEEINDEECDECGEVLEECTCKEEESEDN